MELIWNRSSQEENKGTYVDFEYRRNSKLSNVFGIVTALSVQIGSHWRYIWILPSTEWCLTLVVEMNSNVL